MGKITSNLQYHKTLQELIKIAQFSFNAMAFHANTERYFPWCSRKPKLSGWTSFYSLKLVCNLKHFSCKQLHKFVKGDSAFLGNLRNLQNIKGLHRSSK